MLEQYGGAGNNSEGPGGKRGVVIQRRRYNGLDGDDEDNDDDLM